MVRRLMVVLAALAVVLALASPASAGIPRLSVVSTTDRTATISWSAPPSGAGYTVGWWENTSPYRSWESRPGDYRVSPLTLTGLLPQGSYSVYIVVTRNGRMDWGQAAFVTVTTRPAPSNQPGRVPWIKSLATTTNTITVDWGLAPGADRYELSWRELSTGRVWVGRPPAYTDYARGPVRLTGLKPHDRYFITVMPYRGNKAGAPASIYIWTLGTQSPRVTAPPAGISPPTPTPKSAPTSAPYYANCDAVRAAGKAPLLRGQPGYAPKLDRDGDGVACE